MKHEILWVLLLANMLILPSISAAHFIVGIVEDAHDGTLANGKTVLLWNPANGIDDNLTDIVGPSGNSGADNIYLIDCELLSNPCSINDQIKTKVINNGDNYLSEEVNRSITGAGFDVMPNITLNSPPVFTSIIVDDTFTNPSGEIDLTPAATTAVTCEGIILEHEGNETLANASAELFEIATSSYGDADDNNAHYTNSTCSIDKSYGNQNQAYFICGFDIEYYANSGNWNCTVQAQDNLTIATQQSNTTTINTLLALSIPSPIDFGKINASEVSAETEVNVTNVGNAQINLSLSGYGAIEGDGNAMNCTLGNNHIPIYYEKFNLTTSNPGTLTLPQFETNYQNLTTESTIKEFNLNSRQNDLINDAFNGTYWRMYVPPGVAGNCTGNIIFGAVQASES